MCQRTRERFDAIVEAGESEQVDGRHFVPICTLGSGLSYGLIDDLGWALVDGGQLTVFESGTMTAFVEVLEGQRSDFDDQVEKGAAARGFPVDEVLFSFPSIELVQAMLEGSSQHFGRLALMWLLPTELRQLRSAILAVAESSSWPTDLRDLARRLVVHE